MSTLNANIVNIFDKLDLPVYTTLQRNALTAETGMLIYNSSVENIEVYNGNAWVLMSQKIGTFSSPAASGKALFASGEPSGFYWIQPSGSTEKKYCYVDNTNYGGGWVLIQTVGSATAFHGDRVTDHNLFSTTDSDGNAAQTIPFSGTGYSSTDGRRFSDTWVKTLGSTTNGGDEVFNLRIARNGAQPPGGPTDTYAGGTTTDWRYAAFVRYDNGLTWYNSTNNGGEGDRVSKAIDISHVYPFNWETGGNGHYILASSNYRVFDFHSDPSSIQSSRYPQNRFLWQYPGNTANGIYGGSDSFTGNANGNPGYMFIR